jgi:N-acetylglucosaminyldiphosphoundecaprenol N-acetyl-beta-D-mannosaminyltransferase
MSALLSSTRSAELMGVELAALTEPQTVSHVCSALSVGRGGSVLTANLEILRQSLRTPEHLRALEEAELVLADGMPLVWACRAQGTPLPERVSGSTLIWSLSQAAAAGEASVFLAGGTPGAAEGAAARLVAEYHGLEVAGVVCPVLSLDPEDDEAYVLLADDLARSQPDIVFLGLPFAKQVRAIPHLRARLPGSWIVGVGVSFSFVSGELSRAPVWMQRRGLEWVHRLAHQPRLWRRYLLHGIPFALRLGIHALRARRTRTPR